MSIKNYTKHVSVKETPQSEPILGKNQVKNSAGGFVFEVNDFTKLERFLILGTEGGTYYANEKKLTQSNASAVIRCIKTDGKRTLETIVSISLSNRAPKNDPAIFALGLCLKLGDLETRRLASKVVPAVCRIGTHIFSLAEVVKGLGGWGRLTKKAFIGWYESQNPDQLGMNLAKYQSRNGWSHRDILRKTKPSPKDRFQLQSYRWAVGKFLDPEKSSELTEGDKVLVKLYLPGTIQGFELAKEADSDKQIIKLIEKYKLPRECIPTQFLNSPKVWETLLMSGRGMPMTAMIRNLGKMSQIGLIAPLSAASKYITDRLENAQELKDARVHPITLLMAQSIYRAGKGLKGSLEWKADQNVADALDGAFYTAFGLVEPTGKRFLLALDISGSMGTGTIAGTHLTPREGSAAMALLTAKTEKRHHIVGFSSTAGRYSDTGMTELNISPKQTLPAAVKAISGLPFGGTDCALPMLYAKKQNLDVDCFIIYTDSETWAGGVHPLQALQQYRQATGIAAKLIVVGMVSSSFSIADPSDKGMLDIIGFDASVPAFISEFVLGRI